MNCHQLRAPSTTLLLASVLFLTSCTSTIKAPKAAFTGYAPTEKIHLKVALNLTDELRKTEWDQHSLMGSKEVMPIGSALADNASVMARQTFMEMVEINNGKPSSNPVDAVLTPKAVFVGRKPGQTMFSSDSIVIKLEWSLVDGGGNPIWADTINGQGSNKAGWESVLAKSLETTFLKSQRAILSSEAIQQFVAKKYPEVARVQTARTPSIIITNPEVRELCAALQSTDQEQAMDALKKLRRMNAPEAVPEILPCLQESQPNVVRDACRTLAVLGNRETIPYIEPLLKDKRSDVRKDARDAIKKLRAKSP